METYHCDKCGKELKSGALATAITAGSMEEEAGGFSPDSDPYISILCDNCAEGITRAVALMPVTPAHEQAADLLAALEYCANVLTAAGGPTGTEREQAAGRARQVVGQVRTEQKAEQYGGTTREPGAEYYAPVEYMNCEGCGCRIGTYGSDGVEKRVFKTKYAREDCPACGAILCRKCATKAEARFMRSRKPLHERAACYACTHGTHPATTREAGAGYNSGAGQRCLMFTDTAGKPGAFNCEAAPGPGGGHVITCAEAARLLRVHGEALPFDIMAQNYGNMGGEADEDEEGYFSGLDPADLHEGDLNEEWGPFEIWGHETTKPAPKACGYAGTEQHAQAVHKSGTAAQPAPAATVRAVIVVTGNGGGLLAVVPADVPRDVWDDGEAREWAEALGLPGPLDSGEGYEIMTAEDARKMAAELLKAAGAAATLAQEEGTCPSCGAGDLDLSEEETDGEGGGSADWTCRNCGATGTQQRGVVFIEHTDVKPGAGKAAEPPAIYRVNEYSEGRRFIGTLPELDEIARREGASGPGFFSGQIDNRMRPGRKASIWNGNECIADITRIK